MVSKYFDTIETTSEHREFKTHTGTYKGKRISVVSTGIGPDNIDIVFNELDALVNIDFEKRKVKSELTSLDIIRIGTSGALVPEVKVDSFLISALAIGLDNVMHYYAKTDKIFNREFAKAFIDHTQWNPDNSVPYGVEADKGLLKKISSEDRKSTRLNSSHVRISYAVFCLKKKKKNTEIIRFTGNHCSGSGVFAGRAELSSRCAAIPWRPPHARCRTSTSVASGHGQLGSAS